MTVYSSRIAERIGPGATTAPKRMAARASVMPALTAVRVSGHPDFDRVAIDVDGALPGFDVSYVPQIAMDESGEPVAVRGRAFLDVSIVPAGTFADEDPDAFPLPEIDDLAALRGIAHTGDWEGVVSLGIGVAARLPFLVRRLTAPPRIVIDIAHGLPGAGHHQLRRGERGAAVATWQWRLRQALSRDVAVDEDFGPHTETATRDFQRSHGLTANGVVGRRSRAAMEHALGL
ncbi:peptidoglycan-binding domain-containing protein [Pseudonocardia lacus]|uniref:peptidoglycan-binding domain-containing protein n=1 Tax=Pseudonocardia lacus TaxID=2835865 RepID=UPI001BDBEBA9|nr:peptidoglycan-binding protein [Pseudonocardia lacus]